MENDSAPDQVAPQSGGASPSKAALAVKDWIGFAFSALALCVSTLSYYTSNIRVEDRAAARIVDIAVAPGNAKDSAEGYRNGFVVLSIAFVNAGNRPAIITGSTYQLSGRPDLEDGAFGGDANITAGTFPLLIAPHDIRLTEAKIPISYMLANYGHGKRVDAENGAPDVRSFYAGVTYHAVDSSGKLHDAWSGMQVEIRLNPTGWQRLGRVGTADPFPLTPLF